VLGLEAVVTAVTAQQAGGRLGDVVPSSRESGD